MGMTEDSRPTTLRSPDASGRDPSGCIERSRFGKTVTALGVAFMLIAGGCAGRNVPAPELPTPMVLELASAPTTPADAPVTVITEPPPTPEPSPTPAPSPTPTVSPEEVQTVDLEKEDKADDLDEVPPVGDEPDRADELEAGDEVDSYTQELQFGDVTVRYDDGGTGTQLVESTMERLVEKYFWELNDISIHIFRTADVQDAAEQLTEELLALGLGSNDILIHDDAWPEVSAAVIRFERDAGDLYVTGFVKPGYPSAPAVIVTYLPLSMKNLPGDRPGVVILRRSTGFVASYLQIKDTRPDIRYSGEIYFELGDWQDLSEIIPTLESIIQERASR